MKKILLRTCFNWDEYLCTALHKWRPSINCVVFIWFK